jgi:hypothetical protein
MTDSMAHIDLEFKHTFALSTVERMLIFVLIRFTFAGGERNNTPAGCVLSLSTLPHLVSQESYRAKSNGVSFVDYHWL